MRAGFQKMFVLQYVLYYNIEINSGRGAVWLARVTGGHEVAGSSPVAPIAAVVITCERHPLATGLLSYLWQSEPQTNGRHLC
jgi:hypothetical protein